ncbi:MAG: delta-60 repeat domain-containing protein, partial [Flavobacteriales bacterium]|nr:delta-60 repeat domain-containing protein [Flavobacteriales bacterium]
SNGTLDPSFGVGLGATGFGNPSVEAIALLPSGKVMVGGLFSDFNGHASPNLAMLNSDGSVDASFSVQGAGFSGQVNCIAASGTNRILVGGWFLSYDMALARNLIKLDLTGSQDNSLNTASGFDGHVDRLIEQPDGKILAGGWFYTYNGGARTHIARLSATGALDAGFAAGLTLPDATLCMALRSDGRVIVGADLPAAGRDNLFQLTAAGALDPTFIGSNGINGPMYPGVSALAVQPDGGVIIAGIFTRVDGVARQNVARLTSTGNFDPSFGSFGNGTGPTGGGVSEIIVQPDGAVLMGGTFLLFNGASSQRIIRLLGTGQYDGSFIVGSGFNGPVASMVLQTDGKVLVLGNFSLYNGTPCDNLVRLQANGAIDGSFQPGDVPNDARDLALQADGKVLVGGMFTAFAGAARNRVVRLQATGAIDTSFDPGVGPNAQVNDVLVQPDGRVLIGGLFSQVSGASRAKVARLMADGSLDPSFVTVPNINNVNEMLLQGNGKVVIRQSASHSRLWPDGTYDQTFTCSTSGLGPAYCSAFQPDEKLVVGGLFTGISGTGRNRIARVYTGDTPILVAPKMFLGGPFNSGTQQMSDALRIASLIPSTEPYTALGYTHTGGGGGETVAPSVVAVTGANAIVDWVVVELRKNPDPSVVVASRSALVQRDGDVVGTDGFSPVSFNLPAANYYVAVRHRNHLGAMRLTQVALGPNSTAVDFTLSGTATYGTNARNTVNGTMVLWPGDANFNRIVKYAGSANDRDVVLQVVGGGTPTNVVSNIYSGADINLDGSVKYAGSSNDRDIILQTIGGTVPTATRTQQLP